MKKHANITVVASENKRGSALTYPTACSLGEDRPAGLTKSIIPAHQKKFFRHQRSTALPRRLPQRRGQVTQPCWLLGHPGTSRHPTLLLRQVNQYTDGRTIHMPRTLFMVPLEQVRNRSPYRHAGCSRREDRDKISKKIRFTYGVERKVHGRLPASRGCHIVHQSAIARV